MSGPANNVTNNAAARFALVLCALILSACDAPKEEAEAPATEAERDVARELALEAEKDNTPTLDPELRLKLESAVRRKALQAQDLEPVNKDVRVIGEGEFPAPEIEGDTVERLAPPKSAQERNQEELARLPVKPDLFHRPLVVSAGTIRSGEVTIHLAGIKAPDPGESCSSSSGAWPCGNFAKSSLQRLVRSRTLSCEGEKTEIRYEGYCKVGNTDLSRWLVAQGWAKSGTKNFDGLERAAREEGKGLWRK